MGNISSIFVAFLENINFKDYDLSSAILKYVEQSNFPSKLNVGKQ